MLTPGTNLEQVSDWLTKLLLGAGLTQLGRLGGAFASLTEVLARALTAADTGPAPAARALAGSLVLLYLTLGFLFGYVMTALWYYRRLKDLLEPESPDGGAAVGPTAVSRPPIVPVENIP